MKARPIGDLGERVQPGEVDVAARDRQRVLGGQVGGEVGEAVRVASLEVVEDVGAARRRHAGRMATW